MQVDFLTRFKGRTSTMNKREGVTGIIRANATPIDKLPPSYTFSSYIANTPSPVQLPQIKKLQSFSNDVTPKNLSDFDSKVQTRIQSISKQSRGSPFKPPIDLSKSQNISEGRMHIPLSKTGNVGINLTDFELVAIPRRLLQYGIDVAKSDVAEPQSRMAQNISRQFGHKSQSLDMHQDEQQMYRGQKSEVFTNGSYLMQNQRKRSFVLAGMNSMKQ